MMRIFNLFVFVVLAGFAAADTKVDDFEVQHNYSGTWTSNNGEQSVEVSGIMPMASAVFVAVDGRLYISPNMLMPPAWTDKSADGYFGFSFSFSGTVFADPQCNTPLKTVVGGSSGVFNGYVWVGPAQTYSPPQGWGWPAYPQATSFETHPQHGQGNAYLIGAFTFVDGIAQGGIAPPAGPFTPPKHYTGTATYTHPGKAGDPPKRITVTNPDGTKETFTIQPGQTWTATISGTIGGGGDGSLPTVVIEDVGPPSYNPDTGKHEPTYTNPQTLPVEYDSGDIVIKNPEDVPTESDNTFTVVSGAVPPANIPPSSDVGQPSPGITNPNPVDPVTGQPSANPNPNLDALNTTLAAGNKSLEQIDENLDDLIQQGKQREENEKARAEEYAAPDNIREYAVKMLDKFKQLFQDPVAFVESGYNDMADRIKNGYKSLPGYSDIAGFIGAVSSGMSYEAPSGVIPESISFSLMGRTYEVKVPYKPIKKILNIIRVAISAWAVWFYYRTVWGYIVSGLGIALNTPPSSGSTRAEVSPSAAGFSLGKVGGPVIMLVMGAVVIMGCMASLFAILALQMEAQQPFLSFLGNLDGALGDFVQTASGVSIQIGNTSVNIGGALLEIIGDCLPLGLLFSFCLLGPLWALVMIYLPCVVLGSALLWYIKSIT